MSCSHKTRRRELLLSVNKASCLVDVFEWTFTASVVPLNKTQPARLIRVLLDFFYWAVYSFHGFLIHLLKVKIHLTIMEIFKFCFLLRINSSFLVLRFFFSWNLFILSRLELVLERWMLFWGEADSTIHLTGNLVKNIDSCSGLSLWVTGYVNNQPCFVLK